MARPNFASLVRCLKKYGGACFSKEMRSFSTASVGAVGISTAGHGIALHRILRELGSIRFTTRSRFFDTLDSGWRRHMSSNYSEGVKNFNENSRPMDRLILRGCKFHGFHGVLAEENTLGQKFMVDLDAWLDLRKAGESDDLHQTVSYADVFSTIQEIVEGPSRNLVETVAHEIACSVLRGFPQIREVRVKIYKAAAPISGYVECLGIEIYRTSSVVASKS